MSVASFDLFADAIERVLRDRADLTRQVKSARMGLRLISDKTTNPELKAIAEAALQLSGDTTNNTKP